MRSLRSRLDRLERSERIVPPREMFTVADFISGVPYRPGQQLTPGALAVIKIIAELPRKPDQPTPEGERTA